MLDKILRFKHWQIFIVVFAIPMVIFFTWYGFFIIEMIRLTEGSNHPEPEEVFGLMNGLFSWMLPVFLIWYAIMITWFWSLGISLQKYMAPDIRRKTGFFKVTLIFPLVYAVFMLFTVINLIPHFAALDETIDPKIDEVFPFNPSLLAFIIPIHLFAVFCQLYNYYFIAKTIKSGQLGRVARFSDYVGEFFLFFVLPIGVWILQPIVNKIVDQDNEENLIIRD